jgi:hypothetical protein
MSEGIDRVQFADSATGARKLSQLATDTAVKDASSSEKSRQIDDEEQARRIAEDDLHAGRKQVRASTDYNPSDLSEGWATLLIRFADFPRCTSPLAQLPVRWRHLW